MGGFWGAECLLILFFLLETSRIKLKDITGSNKVAKPQSLREQPCPQTEVILESFK